MIKNVQREISDIAIEIVALKNELCKLQIKAENEFIIQEEPHSLSKEYVILFHGISHAIDMCEKIQENLKSLKTDIT